MINNKYDLIEKISEGAFGKVYKGLNIRSNEYVAIKIESKKTLGLSLKNEAKMYQYLKDTNEFPTLKWYGSSNEYNYLIIDLLGDSLSSFIKMQDSNLDEKKILATKMINKIKILHDKHIIHRDIKPDNFLFGLKNKNNLYLIDLGFCKNYIINGVHIKERSLNNLIGSPNFVSLNVHNRLEPSRRDDLESIIYIIIYIFVGHLKWIGCKEECDIIYLKNNIYNEKDIPEFIFRMLAYVKMLKFDERPNYNYLLNQI